MIGTTLSHYRVTAQLGAGGMGEVYRAEDTTLSRDVAIKVLPADVAGDEERLARFEREARLLASLNHPNIAHVYGFERATLADDSTVHFLAMELVEGEELAERLSRGPIPVDEAIGIAKQIAQGLEEAHEHGIVHRDLKPANVKVTPDGKVKVLDFGLAKAWAGDAAAASGSSVDLSQSPTLARTGTQAGVILGTAAYMSPEQARGKPVDKRADIWAFGVVLFEMLSGRSLFEGETVSDVLAAVLMRDADWSALPASTPGRVRELLRRCLARNPRNRLHDIADARIVLEESSSEEGAEAGGVLATAPVWRRALPWLLAGLAGAALAATAMTLREPGGVRSADAPVSRFEVHLPAEASLRVNSYPGRALAISEDGTRIAYTPSLSQAETRLWLRPLAENAIRPIPGSEGAQAPFFSPDGAWIAFFDAEGTLGKIAAEGGRPITLARGFANALWMFGTWCDDGRIVFDTWNAGLRAVSSEGGDVRVLTQPTDEWHLDPRALPGGCRFLFSTQRADGQSIDAMSADGGPPIRVLDNASHGRYLGSGHLLFVREGALQVAPFDVDRLKVTGAAIPLPIDPLMDSVKMSAPTPQLEVSRNGTLVYAPGSEAASRGTTLLSVDLEGRVEEIATLPVLTPALALSPDGDALAFAGRRAGKARIDALDLVRGATSTLVDPGRVDMPAPPVWTPDGKAILFARYGPSSGEIVRHALDGSSADQVLLELPGTWLCPSAMSPDGRYLVLSRYVPETGADLVSIDLEDPRGAVATPLVATAGSDVGASISPDGEWFAYLSDEAGQDQVLIERFPGGGEKTLVGGGAAIGPPLWSPDGRHLYFLMASVEGGDERDMMAVPVDFTPRLRAGEPHRLFSGRFVRGNDMGRGYAISPDGRRFLMEQASPDFPTVAATGHADRLLVVQNWHQELLKLVPVP